MPDIEPIDRAEPSMTALVTGIVNDAQELIKQQLALFKSEIRADLARAREAAATLTLGLSILCLGGVLLTFMFAHLLASAYEIPTWAGFGIVGGALVVLGLVLYGAGRSKLAALHPLPEGTVRAVKENVQWLKNQK
jgi:hypothetical protein